METLKLLVKNDLQPALLTRNSTIISCNQAALDLLEATVEEDVCDNSLVELFEDPQPDGRRILETGSMFNAALKKPAAFTFYVKSFGSQAQQVAGKWLNLEFHYLKNLANERLFLIRMQASQDEQLVAGLQEKEKKLTAFQQVLNHLPAGLISLDSNLNVLYANTKALEILKLEGEQHLHKKPLKEWLHEPEALSAVKTQINRAIEEKQPQHLILHVSKTHRWLECTILPLINVISSPHAVLFQLSDITALKAEESNCRQRKESFRQMIESSLDVVTRYDRELRHLFISSNVRKYMGPSPKEFIGKKISELEVIPKHLLPRAESTLQELFEKGEPQRLLYPLSKEKWVEWYVVPIFNKQKQVSEALGFSRDLTYYKKIQTKLRQNRQKKRFALNIARLASFEVDPVKGAFLLDKTLARTYGLPIGEARNYEINVFKFIDQFLHKAERKRARVFYKQLLKPQLNAAEEVIAEYNVQIKGKNRYLIFKNKISRNENGEVKRWFGTVQDISEIKNKEKELMAYRQHLQQLVEQRSQDLKKREESLSDAMKLARLATWEYDPQQREFSGDEQIAEMLGILKQGQKYYTVKVEDYLKMVHPLDYTNFEVVTRKAFHARSEDFVGHVEHRVTHPNGEVRYLYFSIKFLLDESHKRKLRFYGIAQDITSIWKLESEIETRSTIIETTPDIICAFAKDGSIIYLNRSGKKKFRMAPYDELSDFTVFFESDKGGLKPLQLVTKEMIRTADLQGQWNGERELVLSKGKKYFVTGTVQTLEQPNRTIFLLVFRDISEQKKAERELFFKKEEFDAFVRRASQDLKGPVASLEKLNVLIEREVTDPKLSFYLEMFKTEVQKLQNILISLIQITTIRREEVHYSPAHAEEILMKCLDELQSNPAYEHAKINWEIHQQEVVGIDRHLYYIMLINLLRNSLDYRNGQLPAEITIRIFVLNNQLITEVTDRGAGMEPAIQQKAFEMFYRGNEASKGPGLGLYMVKIAVKKLNGDIEMISQAGHGTIFRLHFPLQTVQLLKAA